MYFRDSVCVHAMDPQFQYSYDIQCKNSRIWAYPRRSSSHFSKHIENKDCQNLYVYSSIFLLSLHIAHENTINTVGRQAGSGVRVPAPMEPLIFRGPADP